MFPILAERRRQDAGTLSGGEQQMCAIGRGLMAAPSLLMIDELSLGLAPRAVELLTESLREVNKSGVAILLVEQDVMNALELADRAYVIDHGRVTKAGPAMSLASDPAIREAYMGIARCQSPMRAAVLSESAMSTLTFEPGGYRFVKGVFQYSAGVAAMPGYRIVRVRFREPVPLAEGFRRIEQIIGAAGRPLTAFCACELRSPAPFTESGFRAFNEIYVGTLERWGMFDGKTNPVARSNVCPAIDPPAEPSFHAFTYTETAPEAEPSFVIAGSGEAPEGHGNYRDHIVRLGDVSAGRHARKGALRARRDGAPHVGDWASAGRTPRRRRSTPSTTSIRSSPTRSSAAAPRAQA